MTDGIEGGGENRTNGINGHNFRELSGHIKTESRNGVHEELILQDQHIEESGDSRPGSPLEDLVNDNGDDDQFVEQDPTRRYSRVCAHTKMF